VSSVAALLAAILVVLAGCGGSAASSGPARFEFGRTGGNIAPFSVVIDKDGTISHSGAVRVAHPGTTANTAELLRYAQSHGFWTLPGQTACFSSLPDVASLYVTIHTAARTHRVAVRGQCSPRFSRIYSRLAAAATVSMP
jgi:hypothetical protein